MPGIAITILTTFSDAFEDSPDTLLSKDALLHDEMEKIIALIDEFMGLLILMRAVTPKWNGWDDDFTDGMKAIVDDTESVLNILDEDSTPCKFTLEPGVIIPLYLAGPKFRVSAIRTKAKYLLFGWPRREDVWDSRFAGRDIEWMQTMEKFLKGDIVPIWGRVGIVAMIPDLPNRKVEVVYYQQASVKVSRVKARRATISWRFVVSKEPSNRGSVSLLTS